MTGPGPIDARSRFELEAAASIATDPVLPSAIGLLKRNVPGSLESLVSDVAFQAWICGRCSANVELREALDRFAKTGEIVDTMKGLNDRSNALVEQGIAREGRLHAMVGRAQHQLLRLRLMVRRIRNVRRISRGG